MGDDDDGTMEVWHYTSFGTSAIVDGKAALIIIFNEGKHAGNIPVLEKMYGGRFSHIYHLVPGSASSVHEAGPNVISVDGDHRLQIRCLWDEEDKRRLGLKHGWKLDSLFSDYPDDCLFVHPVKLSQWNTDIGSVG